MSLKTAGKIFDLEVSILQQFTGNGMNAEDARKFFSDLISYYEEFMRAECDLLKDYPDQPSGIIQNDVHFWIDLAECVQKKIANLQKMLKGVFFPLDTAFSVDNAAVVNNQTHENDATATAVNLNTLFRKQRFYVEMINSLAPECELSSEKAELQYEHVSQLYEKFILSQNEIITLVGDDAFDDQINISKEVQQKVISLQETFKKIFSPNNVTTLPESEVNEQINPIDRPNDIVDGLDSLYKKQRSIIKQIELIESKNNLGAVDAETLRSHLSQLHELFIQNQGKIETYVNGPALDKELKFSCEILEKVMSLQTKLNKIDDPSKSSSEEPVQKPKPHVGLYTLTNKQQSLIKDIGMLKSISGSWGTRNFYDYYSQSVKWHMDRINQRTTEFHDNKIELESWLKNLLNLKEWFISNQVEIEKLVDEYELQKQRKVSDEIQAKLTKLQMEYELFSRLFGYLDFLNQEKTMRR